MLQPRTSPLAEAQRHLNSTRTNVEVAMRVCEKAEALSQRVAGQKSGVTRAVRSNGVALIQNLLKDTAIASIQVELARTVAAADCCVQSHADEARAEEAMAALNLSGTEHVVIRPPGRSQRGSGQALYDVMVPPDLVVTAAAVLLHPQISRVKSLGNASNAIEVMQALEAQGIDATVRPMKVAGSANTRESVFNVFVFAADAEGAQRIVGGATDAPNL